MFIFIRVLLSFTVIAFSSEVYAQSVNYTAPSRGISGTNVTVAVPGIQAGGGPVQTVSGPVGMVRPAPSLSGRTTVTFQNDGQIWDIATLGQSFFPRYFEVVGINGGYAIASVGPASGIFSQTERYLPAGSCIYAVDGYRFYVGDSRNTDFAESVINRYLYIRPKTDYAYIEYFATSAAHPCGGNLANVPRYGVVFPMAQWTATYLANRARTQSAYSDRNASVLRAGAGILTALVVGAMTQPRAEPDESIWTGRGGCPMFSERHYDGSCW